MDRQGKAQLKTELAERLGKANAVILAEYRGLTVEQVTNLRTSLREHDAEFTITKNRILKLAVADHEEKFGSLSDHLKGPLGAIYAYGDVAGVAKAVLEFKKENELFEVKAGVMDGEPLDQGQLKALSDLPSREVLLGQLVGTLVAPHKGIMGVLNAVPRNLVQVINAIKDKKES